jgi:hypothetical protein
MKNLIGKILQENIDEDDDLNKDQNKSDGNEYCRQKLPHHSKNGCKHNSTEE